MNTEATGRAKRDKRRANEKKTKAIQRIQLSMTAPMDIGQEFADAQLAMGEDEVFNLGEAEKRGMRDIDASSSESEEEDDEEEDVEMLDSDDERERKAQKLEGALDGMYDTYKQRMAERDAKWRAREAREKDKKNDAWAGIRKDSDVESSSDDGSDGGHVSARKIAARVAVRNADDDDDESEDGGWDAVQAAKARNDEDSDSDSDSDSHADEVEEKKALPSNKKRRAADGSATLITTLDDGKMAVKPSKAAQVWFSQDLFKGVGNIDDIEDDDEEDPDATEDDSSTVESELEVCACCLRTERFPLTTILII